MDAITAELDKGGAENAVSVAGVLLLTEATLTEVPEPKGDGMPSREREFDEV